MTVWPPRGGILMALIEAGGAGEVEDALGGAGVLSQGASFANGCVSGTRSGAMRARPFSKLAR